VSSFLFYFFKQKKKIPKIKSKKKEHKSNLYLTGVVIQPHSNYKSRSIRYPCLQSYLRYVDHFEPNPHFDKITKKKCHHHYLNFNSHYSAKDSIITNKISTNLYHSYNLDITTLSWPIFFTSDLNLFLEDFFERIFSFLLLIFSHPKFFPRLPFSPLIHINMSAVCSLLLPVLFNILPFI